ncbi:MAG: amidophosphoribosyltransferase [Treponema sp.]|nr:amidophosphoribosyltransferase [Treponema sp.]
MTDDKFHDECGVVGIFGADNAARLSYFALTALQHRGQESAGIAVCNTNIASSEGAKISLCKDMGLVGDVFSTEHLQKLSGNISVGHVRYATAGGRTIENAQPFLNSFKNGSIALCHNGQLVNHAELRAQLEDGGSTFSSSSDSEVILKLIVRKYIENGGKLGSPNTGGKYAEENRKRFIDAVVQTAGLIKGSFALCIMTENMLIGVRDPNGIRPLCLGEISGGVAGVSPAQGVESNEVRTQGGTPPSYIIASEICAIDAVNGKFLRDLEGGEIVVVTKEGLSSIKYAQEKKRTCIFEYVYFARPDSVIDGISVQNARYRMGEVLARESSVEADVVIGVPDSGIGAALGYAKASGIPYVTGIIKNKYIGRTFIAPTQAERESMVFVKLNAIKSDLEGKRVIVIDDSIVRGTTSRRLVQLLRKAGAREVHFRVSSPPVKFPCYLGIDTPSKAELISSTHELESIRKEIGADSLAFISLKGMLEALGADTFCKGCFNGEYPV